MNSASFQENNALFSPFIAGSGMFTCNYNPLALTSGSQSVPTVSGFIHPPSQPLLFNPMPQRVVSEVKDTIPVERQERFLSEYHRVQKCKLFDRSEIDDYTSVLFSQLAPSLVQCNHDVLVFPLRGCRQPGILAKVIAGIPENRIVVINYTYSTRQTQQGLIAAQLLDQLRIRIPEKPVVSIGIVDTAKGGYGSEHLARLLTLMHDQLAGNQSWSVQFHLLHEKGRTPELSQRIPMYSKDGFLLLWPMFYPVDSLLVEDWSEGIGLSVVEREGRFELRKCSEPGRILYRDATSVQLIESQCLAEMMTGFLVDSVNRQMLGDPVLGYVRDLISPESEEGGHSKGRAS